MEQKKLIVYFSLAGNTEKIVEELQKVLCADVCRLEPVVPYTGTQDEISAQGLEETKKGYLPEIKPQNVNLDDYQTVIIGTPTWWYTMAPVVHTFIHANKWNEKTVVPFMTNAGWPGHVIKDMKSACQGAIFCCEHEFLFSPDETGKMEFSRKELQTWIEAVKAL